MLIRLLLLTLMFYNVFSIDKQFQHVRSSSVEKLRQANAGSHQKKHTVSSALSNKHSSLHHQSKTHANAEPGEELEEVNKHLKDLAVDKLGEWSKAKAIPLEDIVELYKAADEIKDVAEKVSELIRVVHDGEEILEMSDIPFVSWFFLGYDIYKTMKCISAWTEPEFAYRPTHEVPHPNKYIVADGTDTTLNECTDPDTLVRLLRIALAVNKLIGRCDEEYFCTSIGNTLAVWGEWLDKCPKERDAIASYMEVFELKGSWLKWIYQGSWLPDTECKECFEADCPCYGKKMPRIIFLFPHFISFRFLS